MDPEKAETLRLCPALLSSHEETGTIVVKVEQNQVQVKKSYRECASSDLAAVHHEKTIDVTALPCQYLGDVIERYQRGLRQAAEAWFVRASATRYTPWVDRHNTLNHLMQARSALRDLWHEGCGRVADKARGEYLLSTSSTSESKNFPLKQSSKRQLQHSAIYYPQYALLSGKFLT